jgi:hypothetical protein
MSSAWSRRRAALSLSAAVLVGGMILSAAAYAQAPSRQAPSPVAAAAQLPTPRTADGKPDLSGIWVAPPFGLITGAYDDKGSGELVIQARDASVENFENDNALRRLGDRNKPLYKPEFWAKVRENDANGNKLDPEFKCRMYGVPRLGAPSQIVQTPGQVVLLYSGGFAGQNTFRVVPTDGRPHNEARVKEETWKGDPVAHWEGDTLVIDTIGFTDESWLHKSGYFHSFKLHVVERLTRTGNTLRLVTTVEDPDVLMEPWVMDARTMRANPNRNALLPESSPCSDRDREHIVTKERS